MTKLAWDKVGERLYETGVDRGVLYIPNATGVYNNGYSWNGLTAVTESPSGAESNKQYADNQVYLNLTSAEEFGGTIEAFTYPTEFEQCDGTATPMPGIGIGQQGRKTFGFAYRTRLGNDLESTDFGYKLHLIYGAQAAPSEKAYATVNESPEAMTLSWEVTTTPVEIEGINPQTGKPYKPTASLTIDSTNVDAAALANLEDALYGTAGTDPRLPTPNEVLAFFSGTVIEAVPAAPTFDSATDTITIPSVAGVVYMIDDEIVPAGPVVITEDTIVTAKPASGYRFPAVSDDDWFFKYVA
jgi:hypothetical protein